MEKFRKCHGQTSVNEGDFTTMLGLSRRGGRTEKIKRFWWFRNRRLPRGRGRKRDVSVRVMGNATFIGRSVREELENNNKMLDAVDFFKKVN